VHELLLRVVMLTYSATIIPLLFSQFGADVSLSYPSLHSSLQRPFDTLEQLSNEKLKAVLWLLVVIGISVLDNTVIDIQL